MPRSLTKSVHHLRRLFTRHPSAEKVDMSGRRVIVTGASPNSLGYETARVLASWGASVVVTRTRNIASMADSLKGDLRRIGADENQVTAHSLDLCDVNSVDAFATWYGQNHDGRLHVLINNAGIHKNMLSPREKPPLSKDGFEIHWRTNYLGTFHLTSLLLPFMNRSGLECGDARVINVSSHLHDRVKNEHLFNSKGRYHSWDACLRVVQAGADSLLIRDPEAVRGSIQLAVGGTAPGVRRHQPYADGSAWSEDRRRFPSYGFRAGIHGIASSAVRCANNRDVRQQGSA